MAVGKLAFRHRLIAMRSAGGQSAGGPIGWDAQSKVRMRSPMAPPPWRKLGMVSDAGEIKDCEVFRRV